MTLQPTNRNAQVEQATTSCDAADYGRLRVEELVELVRVSGALRLLDGRLQLTRRDGGGPPVGKRIEISGAACRVLVWL